MIYDQDGDELTQQGIQSELAQEFLNKVPGLEIALEERCKKDGLTFRRMGNDMNGMLYAVSNEVYALRVTPGDISWRFLGRIQ